MEKNFFISESLDAGLSVEYWDLSQIYFPYIKFEKEIKRNYVRKIKNYIELEELFSTQNIDNCCFVVMITFGGDVIKLFKLLTKYRCYLIFFARSGIPVGNTQESFLKKLVKYCSSHLNTNKIRMTCLNRLAEIYKSIGLIKNYDLIFTAGSAEAVKYGAKSKIAAINHFDYDNYLDVKNKAERIVKTEYGVFLDDNLVYDTDFQIAGIKTIDSDKYFRSLSCFFDKIEEKYSLQIVIAAHPKAKYQGDEFGNRKIIQGKTSDLVKDCRFAFAHYSTSISFAVLFKKPVLFIYSYALQNMPYFRLIKHFAEVLDAGICNVDTFEGNEELPVGLFNVSKYNDYKYRYLTSESSEKETSSGVFIRQMKRLSVVHNA